MADSNGHKTLIIAEKPSVARDLARVLGKVPNKGDWFENDELVIDSAVGHLVELNMPEDVDAAYKRWKLEDLPIIPKQFKLKPIKDNEKKFKELKKLIRRKDVGTVVNACDAGREGELIFTYICELAGNQKPVKRMWMSSMTPDAIRSAFNQMRDDAEMQPLQDAARSRSEADWLVGINATRAATLQYGSLRNSATVGRVQTPTLALVCKREEDIRNFKPRDYWRIEAEFGVHAGTYLGLYQKANWKKGDDEHDRIDRIWDKAQAEQLLKTIEANGLAEVTEEQKRTRQSAPRLYDLTSLQREANSRYGFPAGMTLSLAQKLYEQHKMLTYPRTDSRALPEDYGPTVKQTLKMLDEPYAVHAEKILGQQWVKPGNKRIFNNKQVSDHFAIIPTDAKPKKLNDERLQKLYDMVVRRFLAVFFPPAEFDVTTRLSLVGEHTFKTEGKVLAVAGWLATQGREQAQAETLTPLSEQDGEPAKAKLVEATLHEEATRPPPRYSEATLLAAMESAGKFVESDELAEAMKERGLGTPATRAATIDHLLRVRYLLRDGRELIPTAKAEGLMEFLRKLDVDVVSDPTMTGEWEYKLRLVEEGKLSREAFMQGIVDMTQSMIGRMAAPPPTKESTIISPVDDKPMLETHKGWVSQATIDVRGRAIPAIQVNKVIGNRRITEAEAQELVSQRELGPMDGFTSKAGKPYAALLRLVEKDNGSLRVDFDFGDSAEGGNGDDVDLSQYPIIGKSPVDAAPVHATPSAYLADSRDKAGKPTFRMSRVMLGRTMTEPEMKQLLETGKSPLLKGMKSKRTGRNFDAFLKLKDDGGIEFEFPPRKKAAKKARKKAAKKSN